MRLVVRWSMGLVALAAAALSYQSLMQLAVLAGYGRLAILYPLVVDAGAAASCAAWLHTRGRQPLVMTWCLLTVSVVLNGTTHYLESTRTAPSWLLVVAVAAVPPTVLGLTVHLAVGIGAPGQPSVGGELTGPATPGRIGGDTYGTPPEQDVAASDKGRPGIERVGARTEAGPTSNGSPGDDAIARLISDGVGRRRLAAELNISEHQARQLITASRNGAGDVSS